MMINEELVKLNNNLDFLKLDKLKEELKNVFDSDEYDNTKLVKLLLKLTNDEVKDRNKRAKEINIHISNFPYVKDISMFDFDFQPNIDRNKINNLLTLSFIEKAENIVFMGLPGTGKTMLSVCIGVEAASNRISTYFVSCNRLLTDLKKAKFENKLEERLKTYCKYKLLILDEVGFLPLNKDDANLLFQLISLRYEKKSTIITTNIEFSKWGDSLNDPIVADAILDRFLHHCHVIKIDGPSYRTKDIINLKESQ